MADFKGCDVHDKEFPYNLVPADTVTTVYVQKEEQGTDRKKHTTAIFVGQKEGLDVCHKCLVAMVMDRLSGIKTDFTWRRSHWEMVDKVNNKTGQTYQALDRVFEDVPVSRDTPPITAKV